MNSGVIFYLVVANAYVFFLMWLDWKQQADEKKSWPVAEWQMLLLGLCGGGIGGLLAVALFQYKRDRKRMLIIYQLGTVIAVILFAISRGWV